MTPEARLIQGVRRGVAPPPKVTLSQWAGQNRILSSESSSAPGAWRSYQFQRDILDAFTDPRVETLVCMSATQMIKTELILNAIAFTICVDPGPMLLVVPHDVDGEKFSKSRLAPMLRDTPILRGKVIDSPASKSSNTLSFKSFSGGHLVICASGSPANLSALPTRILLADEVDKYPVSAGSEGDPLALAARRLTSFWNSKKVFCCSPTIDGSSRIQRAFEGSDMREFYVGCPRCGGFQTLKFREQVKWENGLPTKELCAGSCWYECELCQAHWSDRDRWKALEGGRWIASAPFQGIAGFKVSELASPWRALHQIVLDFLIKKDDVMQLKTFINTSLCEVWKEKGEQPEWEKLKAGAEDYEPGIVPRGGLFIVGAVDIQQNRLAFSLEAYGRDRQCWTIYTEEIPGDPQDTSAAGPWSRLDQLVLKLWPFATGGAQQVWAVGIDTGYKPSAAYWYAARFPRPVYSDHGFTTIRNRSTIVLLKGTDDPYKLISGVSTADAAQRRAGLRIYSVGTHFAKTEFYDSLRLSRLEGGSFPPGFIHLPQAANNEFFMGLVSEQRIQRPSGKIEWLRDRNVRNEPLDLHVYCRAVAEVCGLSRHTAQFWDTLENLAGMPVASQAPQPPPQTPPAPARPREVHPELNPIRAEWETAANRQESTTPGPPKRGAVRAKLSLLLA